MESRHFGRYAPLPRLAAILLCLGATTLQPASAQTLRELAQKRGICYGAAVGEAFWGPDSLYRDTLRRQCTVIVAENEMKFGLIEPRHGEFSWSRALTT